MDMSKVLIVIVLLALGGLAYLASSPGVNYLHGKYTQTPAGSDAAQDAKNEAGLSKLGGFLMNTWRYKKANEVMQDAVERYPQGADFWYNKYRMVKCAEKAENFKRAVNLLKECIDNDAHSKDPRVPENANLELRRNKLLEMHGLGEIGRD